MGRTLRGLPRTEAVIRDGIAEGLHFGAQIYVWHDGAEIANAGVGDAEAGVAMTADSVNLWMSSGKPIGAVALALLYERADLDWDDPVARFWPEFAQNGKGAVTLRHILTHTAGLRTTGSTDRHTNRPDIMRAIEISALEPGWDPGERAAYDASAGWHVLGEVVRRVSGRTFEQFVHDEVFSPLGMGSSFFFLTAAGQGSLEGRLAPMHRVRDGTLVEHPAYAPQAMGEFARPGGSLRSTAGDLGRFYRVLLGQGQLEGVSCWNRIRSP